jgi:predicted naringenin-chalcone synthase
MTLSGYVPDLIEEDFIHVINKALAKEKISVADISHWCVHPGGKRILEAINKSLSLQPEDLKYAYDILNEFGNMSSATILFVLKEMMKEKKEIKKMVGAAFGPGLTVETFTAHK